MVADQSDPALFPSVQRMGGSQSDVAPAANLLADAGLEIVEGRPLDESMAFGLAGGIGFLYGVFEYGDQATMTIVARNRSMPDPFLDQLFDITGTPRAVHTTSGARAATRELESHVEAERSTLCTVGLGGLRALGLPPDEAAMLPVVVRVVGADDESLLIEFRADRPLRVEREEFTAARGAVRAAKHRLVALDGLLPPVDTATVLREAVVAGATGFDTPPAAPFASNVGVAGLRKWSELLVATKGPKRWRKVFGSGARAAFGLGRVHDGIHVDYTARSAGRPMYAAFLRDAADQLDTPRLRDAAEAIDVSAGHWDRVASLAAAAHPAVTEYVELGRARLDRWCGRGADIDLAAVEDRRGEAIAECDLDEADAAEVFAAMSAQVAAIAAIEGPVMAELSEGV